MLNANNKIIAKAISKAYCSDDLLCNQSVFNRLNNYFDDTNFVNFLTTLRSRAYLIGGFQNNKGATLIFYQLFLGKNFY